MESHAILRGKLYFAFKDQDVEDLFGRLEKAKDSLQMAYAIYQAKVTQNLLVFQGKTLLGLQAHLVAQDADTSKQPPAPVPVSTSKSDTKGQSPLAGPMYFGMAHLIADLDSFDFTEARRKDHQLGALQYLRFCLPYWLYGQVWEAEILRPQLSLSMELRTYNLVPDRSEIFNFCKLGDLDAMQKLLRSGRAGILDVAPGPVQSHWTLLEVSLVFKTC